MTKLHEITELGQSIWYDNIRRAVLDSGEFQQLLDAGVRGVTSNPTIFEKAIVHSRDYDRAIVKLVEQGRSTQEIYESLALEDISRAADMLRPIYDTSEGVDGFISLEVSPHLANETEGTIAEARRLFVAVNRPNVMIKVPATPAGIPAIQTLVAEGININVTLMFSLAQYEAVAEAYIAGLEQRAAAGKDLSRVASVASFFVSRVDTKVDQALQKAGHHDLQGKIAVANAKVAYARFCEIFNGERWEKLATKGARVQRPLWASTGTKNPSYRDTLYVDTLIGPYTVNTVPPATLEAILDHIPVENSLDKGLDQARADLKQLTSLGISLNAITDELLREGVEAFAKSFESLLQGIDTKRQAFLDLRDAITVSIGNYQSAVGAALERMAENNILPRIWKHDHTVWNDNPDEITNRLDWLTIAEEMLSEVAAIQAFVQTVRDAGYTHALLLGMGGSSLAPEVFARTFGTAEGYLDLAVLDSTDPAAVLGYERKLDLTRTLFIVSTKSGSTVETLSFFKYFYNKTLAVVGAENVGAHFVAITDPGSSLESLAQKYRFRQIFLSNPNIGGRYSALSHFGLVPAALIGVDLRKLLDRAQAMALVCEASSIQQNSGAVLGAILGELAKMGRDKVTFICSPAIESFGDWVEQLIAESTGKSGTGILPIVGEPVGTLAMYGDDRLFIYLRLEADHTHDAAVAALDEAVHPVVRIDLKDRYDFGGQFFLWELATAVAGHLINIQPFNQPNVESAKILARKWVAAYAESGELPPQQAAVVDGAISVYGENVSGADAGAALIAFLAQAVSGDYVALQAYLPPTPEVDEALQLFRARLYPSLMTGQVNHALPKTATTLGYGPRFLHSTGQLHKGDSGNGLFVQLTSDTAEDVPIPDEAGSQESSISFGVLKMTQALGDGEALVSGGRRLIRFHLGTDVVGGLQKLASALA